MVIASARTASIRLFLDAGTAEELMTAGPMSIHQDKTVREAAAILTDREISAVPVIDDAGHPVGVLSRADLVRYLGSPEGEAGADESAAPKPDAVGDADRTIVRDLMTPAVISVPHTAPVVEVVAQLLGLGRIHRLFVTDDTGTLVGVITAGDVLRRLRPQEIP